ncbi:Competence transcription factor [Bacillus sp. THAF10]|uniref:competence protein ComK n=1 Tax=Bacillus sp. THAF10 TaxID=2587848 RepID=UPI001267D7AC|nr:competence protein ComK [Bacillus sp. THAF10]QFT88296.1 Competence transcription factor [Bacillus sp. THAF10]
MINLKNFRAEYEINEFTMVIFPFEWEGKLFAKVLEEEQEIYVSLSPIKIIENSCKFYCSSFEGRKQGTKTVSGYTHKPPIVIDQMNDIFFFPTASPTNENCIWVSLHYAYEYNSTPSANTHVTFPNNTSVEIPVSKTSFETQVYRTSVVRSKLQQRVSRKRHSMNQSLVGAPRFVYRARR